MVAIVGSERFKGGARVEFVCGGRALRADQSLRDSVGRVVKLLSVTPSAMPAAVEKLQADARMLKKLHETVQEQLAQHEADSFSRRAQRAGPWMLVTEAVTGWDAASLKKLASAVVARPSLVAVLVSTERPALLVVAGSSDVPIDAGLVLRRLLDRFGGKGGGKGAVAQAGGLNGSSDDILRAARDEVAQLGGQDR
jgi:alanyl-tRNA synthetase